MAGERMNLTETPTKADARDERLEAEIDAGFERLIAASESEASAVLTELAILIRRRSPGMVLLAEMRWRARERARLLERLSA